MQKKHTDTIIIGAGISGISAAWHLKQFAKNHSFLILEKRAQLGGTWDLFRYPGVRSDSDMATFGFYFKPWTQGNTLANGADILNYLTETVQENDLDAHICYEHSIETCHWSTQTRLWTLNGYGAQGKPFVYTCKFLIFATGYYDYTQGFTPGFKGLEQFKGIVVHPQHWPKDLNYTDKKVVVIGSGATAITLIPALAKKAAEVTMLQRSPTYMASVPSKDNSYVFLQKWLPKPLAYQVVRTRNIAFQQMVYQVAKKRPKLFKTFLLLNIKRRLNKHVNMRHFTPAYAPWEQRLCAVPDADFFKVLRQGKANILTDEIETFNREGIVLKSKQVLNADIIVTATGLNLQMLGGIKLFIDHKAINVGDLMTYKGVLIENIPNVAIMFGYVNASWTLKADLASLYLVRLFDYMQKHHYAVVMPEPANSLTQKDVSTHIMDSLSSGYVKRAAHLLPRQGTVSPWRVLHHYRTDIDLLKQQPIEDEQLKFYKAPGGKVRQAAQALLGLFK